MLNRRILNNILRGCAAATMAAATASCAELGQDAGISRVDYDPERDRGLEELAQPLTALATPCTFGAISGVNTATIAVADAETAVISKRSVDSAILVNGEQCGTATSTTIKRIVVTGSSGTNTVILDFMNGTFAPGYGSSTAGITVDLVSGSSDALKVRGSSSADTVTVGADGVAFNTDSVKDVAYSNVDAITSSLGSGNDIFSASGGYGTGAAYATATVAYGGDGNDTMSGGTAVDTLNGGAGNDTLRGAVDAAADVAADTLNGDAGDDIFDAGTTSNGGDTLNGGAGTDTVSYALRTVAVVVTVGAGANDGEASETDTVASDVENVTGGTLADTLTGSSSNNVLNGGPGADTLDGGDGDDTLNGDADNDTLNAGATDVGADIFAGGAGTDTVTYAARSSDLTIDIDGTGDDGASGEADNVKTDVENVIGGAGSDTITGGSGANVLTGGAGDDVLGGGAGDDTFSEGAADSGSDTFTGGTGTDTVDYSARTAALTVTMDGVTADDGLSGEADDVEADVEGLLGGTGADTITGNDGANTIEGGAGIDTIDGGAGADELFGDAAVDSLLGGAGDDTLDGGAATDTINCGTGEGDIAILGSGETGTGCEL